MLVFNKLKPGEVAARCGNFVFKVLSVENTADEPMPDIPSPSLPLNKRPKLTVKYDLSLLELTEEINFISATAVATGLEESNCSAAIPIFK